eukprot:TRINITY_DN3689_c0_g1_i1.p1 TRINITY_DN3689_c0_g1~~TRINITY_DN3689_c0_g1_i1.p1  ORF type:complete len:356 (-),score=63.69 TRINITY_DN3689_c0_g1_i1:43-1110(-)
MFALLFLSLAFVSSSASPSCALNGWHPPCPLPNWTPQWSMRLSTVIQPANLSGYLDAHYGAQWGLVSLDWANAHSVWMRNGRDHTDCERTNSMNCKMIKQVNPNTRCFIYHNMELALQWLESQKSLMTSEADLFLRYPNGTIYNEPISSGDQYFWDFRNPKTQDAFVNSIISSVTTYGQDIVDGTFTDDVDGLPNEHPNAAKNIGLNSTQVNDLRAATQKTSQLMIEKLVSMGKYNWHAFSTQDGVDGSFSKATCQPFMEGRCKEEFQSVPWLMQANDEIADQAVTAFMISRGPIAFYGYGWIGQNVFPKLPVHADWDMGRPLGVCEEQAHGVFSRRFEKGTLLLDCNKFVVVVK